MPGQQDYVVVNDEHGKPFKVPVKNIGGPSTVAIVKGYHKALRANSSGTGYHKALIANSSGIPQANKIKYKEVTEGYYGGALSNEEETTVSNVPDANGGGSY